MSTEQRQRAFRIFEEICDLPETDRVRRLVELCGSDAGLRDTVESMLESDRETDDLLAIGEGASHIASMIAEDEAGPVPSRIGRYRVVREIGRGGMGIVYEAVQDDPERRVAIKLIRDRVSSYETVRRFQRESALLGRLHDPGIAQIYEAGSDTTLEGRRLFYAMEFIDGLPVDRHADAHELSREQRIELIARVCDAVHHAHQKGVIHRDLKPANVLVATSSHADTETGSRTNAIDTIGQPKIVDFGIARLLDDTASQEVTQQTHAGQVIGSLMSMSPEQLAGDRNAVDTRSDVYAIGVMLYKVLSGRYPQDLSGLSIPEAARRISEDSPPTLASLDTTLRGDLSVIAMKALEREPGERYESAAALADDLRRSLRDEPILARPHSIRYHIQKFTKRNRLAVSAFALGILGMFVTTALALHFAYRAEAARSVSEANAARADQAAYRAGIAAAASAIRDGDVVLARKFLDGTPRDLRGWEWDHYSTALDASIAVGDRIIPWPGETGDFLFSSCWLDPAEKVLHTAQHYFGSAHQFESFDAQSLESINRWSAPMEYRCVGIDPERSAVLFHLTESDEFVALDVNTGAELDRRGSSVHGDLLCSTYDTVPVSWDSLDSLLTPHKREWRPSFGNLNATMTFVSWWGKNTTIFSLDQSRPIIEIKIQPEGMSRAALSPDGEVLAVTTLDRRLELYDAVTGEALWALEEAHSDALMALAFSPDGKIIATSGQDQLIKLWDAHSGELLGHLLGHERTVVALRFSRDQSVLFSAGPDRIRRWRVRDAFDPGVIARHSSFPGGLAVSMDGRTAASFVQHSVVFPDSAREVFLHYPLSDHASVMLDLPEQFASVADVLFLDEHTLAVLGHGSKPGAETGEALIATYRVADGSLDRYASFGAQIPGGLEQSGSSLILHWKRPDLVPLHINAATLQVSEPPRVIEPTLLHKPTLRWGYPGGEVIHDFGLAGADVRRTIVDQRQDRVYASTHDGTLHSFDLQTGELIASKKTSTNIDTLSLLPDGTRLFGGCIDTTIQVWDTSALELVAVLRGHRDRIIELGVSPDGATLYSASDDYTVRAWRTTPNNSLDSR